jgi:hypothetical protein
MQEPPAALSCMQWALPLSVFDSSRYVLTPETPVWSRLEPGAIVAGGYAMCVHQCTPPLPPERSVAAAACCCCDGGELDLSSAGCSPCAAGHCQLAVSSLATAPAQPITELRSLVSAGTPKSWHRGAMSASGFGCGTHTSQQHGRSWLSTCASEPFDSSRPGGRGRAAGIGPQVRGDSREYPAGACCSQVCARKLPPHAPVPCASALSQSPPIVSLLHLQAACVFGPKTLTSITPATCPAPPPACLCGGY